MTPEQILNELERTRRHVAVENARAGMVNSHADNVISAMQDQDIRRQYILKIESYCGLIHSMPYHMLDTCDLQKMAETYEEMKDFEQKALDYQTSAEKWKERTNVLVAKIDELRDENTRLTIDKNELMSH